MKTFYTLSSTAGLIRSNKFIEKADAIAIGSFRAEQRQMPIKVYEHKDSPANKKCILVCNVDGSVEKPEGSGYKLVEADHDAMVPNVDSAHVLLASTQDKKSMTALYLKSSVDEYTIAQLEHELGVSMGLYDDRVLHCYTDATDILSKIEAKLAEASVQIDRMTKHQVRASTDATKVESSARKAALRARAANMPEISARAYARAGGRGTKIYCCCELFDGTPGQAPRIVVFGDGMRIAEVKSDREAARAMADYAERAFGKFLKKEM